MNNYLDRGDNIDLIYNQLNQRIDVCFKSLKTNVDFNEDKLNHIESYLKQEMDSIKKSINDLSIWKLIKLFLFKKKIFEDIK